MRHIWNIIFHLIFFEHDDFLTQESTNGKSLNNSLHHRCHNDHYDLKHCTNWLSFHLVGALKFYIGSNRLRTDFPATSIINNQDFSIIRFLKWVSVILIDIFHSHWISASIPMSTVISLVELSTLSKPDFSYSFSNVEIFYATIPIQLRYSVELTEVLQLQCSCLFLKGYWFFRLIWTRTDKQRTNIYLNGCHCHLCIAQFRQTLLSCRLFRT